MDETRNYINLVLTVKKYPALYDLSCNDYHNRVVRNKMWRTVAQEVNASGKDSSIFRHISGVSEKNIITPLNRCIFFPRSRGM